MCVCTVWPGRENQGRLLDSMKSRPALWGSKASRVGAQTLMLWGLVGPDPHGHPPSLPPCPTSDYAYLREHFREKHFLCEEGRCSTEQFTHAFRTEIDLKAHKMACHSRNRAEARQNRHIDLQFNYTPRHPRRAEGEGPPGMMAPAHGLWVQPPAPLPYSCVACRGGGRRGL